MFWLFRFLAAWPLLPMHAIGAAAGWLAFVFSAAYRRHFLENTTQAGYRFAQVRPAIASAGRMVSELPRAWFGSHLPMRWDGAALIEQAYAQGRGLLILAPHSGCFEAIARGFAERFATQHGEFTVMYRPARQAWLNALLAQARQRPGLRAVPTHLSGVRQMLKALKAGRAIGLLPDQVPPAGMGIWAQAFNRPAYSMTLAAKLAQQSQCTVLLVWSERLSWGRGYCIHVRPLSTPLGQSIESDTQSINTAMENLIRECPQQYLWGYARYKAPRQDGSW